MKFYAFPGNCWRTGKVDESGNIAPSRENIEYIAKN